LIGQLSSDAALAQRTRQPKACFPAWFPSAGRNKAQALVVGAGFNREKRLDGCLGVGVPARTRDEFVERGPRGHIGQRVHRAALTLDAEYPDATG
jgi:hypothetical protein